jgi:hypothetical protein
MNTADNWGWKARIGMFIVSNEPVPEAEWWAMMPPGVSVHAARVTAPTPWARWASGRESVELEGDVERGAKQFATMRLSAVVIAHSSSSIAADCACSFALCCKPSPAPVFDSILPFDTPPRVPNFSLFFTSKEPPE